MSSKDVPYDLVLQVLTWLPVKSLIRLRCVCKLWNSSITNRNFINTHLNKANLLCKNDNNLVYTPQQSAGSAPSKLCMVTCKSDRTITEASRFELPYHPTEILGVCNGLVCFSVKTGIDYKICLWNPSIQKLKMLPTSLTSYLIKPHKSVIVDFGFAYDSQNHNYKIVKILCLHDPLSIKEVQSFEAEVYNLSTNSWRRLEQPEPLRRKFSNIYFSFKDWRNPLFINGALHWIVYAHDDNGWYPSIISFDVHDEKFHSIMLPENGNIDFHGCLADYKGLLAWITLSVTRGCIGTCLWVMKEYGVVKSWAKLALLPPTFVRFLSCSSTGEFLVEGRDYGLALLDPDTQCVNRLGIQGVTLIAHTTNSLESLVLVEE